MNVFVTGGSRGIGRAIVLKFISEGYGCAFSYTNRIEASEETINMAREINPNLKIKSYRMDQGSAEQVEAVVEKAMEDFGSIQILVNNAAINRNNALALMSDDEWHDVIRTI